MEGMERTFSVPFIACQECSDIWYTVYSISTKTIKSEHNRKTKGKESRRKCWRFRERWYYYFCLDILVWMCQRHLSEVIALSVMSLTHHGTQSRRDYIFGHSIITIRELLTWILAPNREQLFPTLPQSLLRIFDKKITKQKKNMGMWNKWNQTIICCLHDKKTCWNVKVWNKRDLFCSLLLPRCFEWFIPCWAAALQTEPHFERHSVHLLSSKPNGSTATINESKFSCSFVWQSLSKTRFVYPHGGQIVFGVAFQRSITVVTFAGRKQGCFSAASSALFQDSILKL